MILTPNELARFITYVIVAFVALIFLFNKGCKQPTTPVTPIVKYVIKRDTIRVKPDTVTVYKVGATKYLFKKVDSAATITGTIISPCKPDTVTIGYTLAPACTTVYSYQVKYLNKPPVLAATATASPGSISLGLMTRYQRTNVGLQYNLVNKSVSINFVVPLVYPKK